MENTNRGMHGDSLPMLSPLGAIEQEAPAFRHGVHHPFVSNSDYFSPASAGFFVFQDNLMR